MIGMTVEQGKVFKFFTINMEYT